MNFISKHITTSLILTLLLFLVHPPRAAAATHTWTGASGDGKWSTAFNWSGNSPPAAGEAASVILIFPAAGAKNSTNDITNLTVDQIQVSGDNYQIGGSGAGTNLTIRSQIVGSAFFLSGNNATFHGFQFNLVTNFTTSAWISVSTGDTATMRSRFTGNGGLQKLGGGILRMQGGAPNTYLGETLVVGGNLELNHNSNAIPADLILGNPSLSSTGTVTLMFQHQIADSANVTVAQNGVFNPSVFRETITSLSISNVNQSSGPSLTVLSNFTTRGQSVFSGILQLAGARRTIEVADGQLNVTGFIENNTNSAGFNKTGPGTLRLAQTNGFNGQVFIVGGKIIAAHNGALGNPATTFVNDGTSLEVAAGISIHEDLVLYGQGVGGQGALILRTNAVCSDLIALVTNPTVINVPDANTIGTLSWIVFGSGGIKKIGNGTLRLSGNFDNGFTGTSSVVSGKLELAKPAGIIAVAGDLHVGQTNGGLWKSVSVVLFNSNQIADTANVFVDVPGLLNLNGYNEGLGSLTLRRGYVDSDTGTLTLLGDVWIKTPQGTIDGTYSSFIDGKLSLGGATRTFTAEELGFLDVSANVSDGGASAGITVKGHSFSDFRLAGGTNTYTGPTIIEDVPFSLLHASTPGTSAGGTTISGASRLTLWNANVTNESLTINCVSNWNGGLYRSLDFRFTNSWVGPIFLLSDAVVQADDATYRLNLGGGITGPGGIYKKSLGTLIFAGPNDNLFAGSMTVDEGVLELTKTSGAMAVPGMLNIGNTNDPGNSASVRLKAHNQIANSAPVSIQPSGELSLGAFNDTIGSLTMRGGDVLGLGGVLTLNGTIFVKRGWQANIYSPVSLGGSTRTVDSESSAILFFDNDVSDGGGNAGITKTGEGSIVIIAPTSYSGDTEIQDGGISLYFDGTPGNSMGQTIVGPGGRLDLVDAEIAAEKLTLYANTNIFNTSLYFGGQVTQSNFWGGSVVVIGDAQIGGSPGSKLHLAGTISGPGGFSVDTIGDVYFTGTAANTFLGELNVVWGTLYLQRTNAVAVPGNLRIKDFGSYVVLLRPEQIYDLAAVTLENSGTLDLRGNAETIGSLATVSYGYVNGVTNTLTLGDNNQSTTFAGLISGGGGSSVTNLIKRGAGAFSLLNDHAYPGKTLLRGGSLELIGSITNSAVTVYSNATLAGHGAVASLTGSGGNIAPSGTNGSPYGKLRSLGSVNLGSSSKFLVDLGGTNAGVNCDQLEMLSGVLTIPGCSLVVTQHVTGAVSNLYPILNVVSGGASMGTFTGLGEGANVISSSGETFRVNYFAGTGNNDIVLTQLSASAGAASFTGILKLPGGIQLDGFGGVNAQYLVQASTNLTTTNWTDLGVINANGTGALQYLDTDATNYLMRFYRLKAQ